MRKTFILGNLSALAAMAIIALFWPPIIGLLLLLIPLLILGLYDMRQTRHTLLRIHLQRCPGAQTASTPR